ncbi:uncharacterized protein LY89DRAFT_181803 [Mollisia scopiformis]|uniref:Uncharacterized protein n=1 Tax=Mollisia scopiformis TaxID=149040 RepID=A0A194XUN3_MOLSC|nr:uncharacterized protein LY89DRAFT_181803 [Mollisia scopiformis]KUJ23417.1 hypothetical protein LY89DRAFT_181803 [Mollisia scopiformis]
MALGYASFHWSRSIHIRCAPAQNATSLRYHSLKETPPLYRRRSDRSTSHADKSFSNQIHQLHPNWFRQRMLLYNVATITNHFGTDSPKDVFSASRTWRLVPYYLWHMVLPAGFSLPEPHDCRYVAAFCASKAYVLYISAKVRYSRSCLTMPAV